MSDLEVILTQELVPGHTYVIVVPDGTIDERVEDSEFIAAIRHMADAANCRLFCIEAGRIEEVVEPNGDILRWYDRGYRDGFASAGHCTMEVDDARGQAAPDGGSHDPA